MTNISNAVAQDRVSSVIGYEIKKGLAGVTGGYLPQRIAVIAEANTDKQVGLKTKFAFTTADEVAVGCGYGSPAHLAARRLRGVLDVGGIPTLVFPLPENGAAVAQADSITTTGAATKSATQFVIVAGLYIPFTVLKSETGDDILNKIKDAINAVLETPIIADAVALNALPIIAKWKGLTSADIVIEFAGDDIGVNYTIAEVAAGAGEVLPTDAVALFGSEWNTQVVNCLGSTSTVLDAYELFNGNSTDKTGRYNAEDFKPCIVTSGTIEDDKDNLIAITDSRKLEQTNVVIPAPKSLSLPFEIAAVAVAVYAPRVEIDPKSDILDAALTGITPPQDLEVGDLDVYDNRDLVVKGGCSTVVLRDGVFYVKDFITTYHPVGEEPPQFRWVRNLAGIDFNIAYRTLYIDETFIKGKTILPDSNTSTDPNVIKPKDAKGLMINKLFVPFANDGIIADANYSIENCKVGINESNPDRFDFENPYKRSGFARIISTTAIANFYLGGN